MGSAEEVQDSAEEVPELGVEDSVDDGVESAVDVAQPGDNAGDLGGDAAGLADSPGDVNHKKRCPAEEESTCQKDIQKERVMCYQEFN